MFTKILTAAIQLGALATVVVANPAVPDPPRHQVTRSGSAWHCGGSTAAVAEVESCFVYLRDLDSQACTVSPSVNMCEFGSAVIEGISIDGTSDTMACYDVAMGLQTVIDRCNKNGQVGGHAFAAGDSNFKVVVKNSNS